MIHNLEYYKVFYYVASCGSVTQAAKKLAVTQPAVSQTMKQLESAVGVRLFLRTLKGVKLTAEGELLYHYIARGYEMMELGEKKLSQMQNLELGEVHIGASDMTLRFYLLPFLERFHEKYPKIRVTVTNAPTPETMAFLKEEKIDFGVVSGPFPADVGIEADPVRRIQDIFVAGRGFAQYQNCRLRLAQLQEMPLIVLEKHTATRMALDAFLEERGVRIQPEFELATSDMIVQFAMRNLGVGSVVEDFAREAMQRGDLFRLELEETLPPRYFYLATRKGEPLSAAAEELLRMIRADGKGRKTNDHNGCF